MHNWPVTGNSEVLSFCHHPPSVSPKGTLTDNERENAGMAQTWGFQLTPCRLIKSNKVHCIYVCVCACVFRMCSCVGVSMCSEKNSVAQHDEDDGKEKGFEKAVADCGVEDPQSTALIGYLPKDF